MDASDAGSAGDPFRINRLTLTQVMTTMDERRRWPRYPIALVATITELLSAQISKGRTSDVSRGGCYVDCPHPLALGTSLRISLTTGSETFEAAARIVYVAPDPGMGICFDEPIPARELEILERWLAAAKDTSVSR